MGKVGRPLNNKGGGMVMDGGEVVMVDGLPIVDEGYSRKVAARVDDMVKKVKDMHVVMSKVEGLGATEIAKAFGISREMVYRILGRESSKKLIELVREDFYKEGLPVAADNMIKALEGEGDIGDKQFRASERVLEGAGVLNSKAPSIYVEQIFNDNRIILSPLVRDIIAGHLEKISGKGFVEAEIVK